jgi:sorbitol/mannitol transport system permease protein
MTKDRDIKKVQHSIRNKGRYKTAALTVTTYTFATIYFFPILYMLITGFKTEYEAVKPSFIFTPTLETFIKVFSDRNMYGYLQNSVFQVVIGTIICLTLGVPAAFILVFGKFKKKDTGDKIYFWFITTILLPPVAVLVPLYTWFQKFGLNKVPTGLLLAYIGFHIPLVVWMVYSFFKDVPVELIEASGLDGCTRFQQLVSIAVPLARTGIIASGLLVAVFIWNEFFLGFNLTSNSTATLPVYLSRFREQQGMFTAQLSASSTIAVLPALILGWMSQKSLVKGLTMGAVKG